MNDDPGASTRDTPVLPLATECVPEVLGKDSETRLLLRLRYNALHILTVQDGQIHRRVLDPRPDPSHLAMTLSDFRKLAAEIEELIQQTEDE